MKVNGKPHYYAALKKRALHKVSKIKSPRIFMSAHPLYYFRKSASWLFTILFFYVFIFSVSSFADDKNGLRMYTGNERGVYFSLGQQIAKDAEKVGIKVNIYPSKGSAENLYLAGRGEADMILAQSDIAYKAYNGLQGFHEKIDNLKTIGSLYTEVVHILIRNPLYLQKIENFRGKRVSIGPEGSGTASNALALLEAAGITPSEVQLLHLDINDAITAIRDDKVDVVFFTSGYPSDVISNLTKDKSVNLFEPNFEIIQRLIDSYPYFTVTTIPATTYPHLSEDITTVGVKAVLLGNGNLDDKIVYSLTKSIFDATQTDNRIEVLATAALEMSIFDASQTDYRNNGKDIKISLSSIFEGMFPLHEGARRFYDEHGVFTKEAYLKVIENPFLIFCLFVIMLCVVYYIKGDYLKYQFNKRHILRAPVILILILFGGAFLLYSFERKINENYSNIFKALWSTLINWINFGQREPYTFNGRITSIGMSIFGIGGLTWLTGEIAAYFIHKRTMGGNLKIDKIKEHHVIINWNKKGEQIIEQLRNDDHGAEKRLILVLTDHNVDMPSYKTGVKQLLGSTMSQNFLRDARIGYACSVIILAEDTMGRTIKSKKDEHDVEVLRIDAVPFKDTKADCDAIDAKTIVSIFTIRKICAETEGGGQVAIVAEILNPSNVDTAKNAGKGGAIEVVSSEHLTANLLAQVAATPGLTNIYNDLLTFGKNTNEIYQAEVPEVFFEHTATDLFQSVTELRSKHVYIVPIAISRKDKIYINPSYSKIDKLEKGDVLYAICDSRDELEKALAKLKRS